MTTSTKPPELWTQRRDKSEIGYAGGTFDLFHAGHVEFLKKCRALCEWLVVSLNSDEFAARYKRKPIMSFDERVAVMKACRYVDNVIPNFGDEDSTEAIRMVRAGKVFHGDEWEREGLMKQMNLTEDWLEHHHVQLIQVPYTKDVSTSDIIQRCVEWTFAPLKGKGLV